MNPGVYFDMDRQAYEELPAYNQTILKKWEELGSVPRDFKYWLGTYKDDKPSDAKVLGNALDCLMFDLKRFEMAYALAPQLDRRTKQGKSDWLKFCHDSAGKAILTADQGNTAMFMASELMVAECSRDIFKHCKKAVLLADVYGFPCKGEIDLWDGNRTEHIWDLKALKDVSPAGFSKAFFDYGYDIQAAMYLALANQLGFVKTVFNFVCVKNVPPYSVQVYSLSPRTEPDHEEILIDAGRRIEIALIDLDRRMKSDDWSNNQDWKLVEIPHWRLAKARFGGMEV